MRATRFNAVVREAFVGTGRWGDFGVAALVRLVIGLLVVGGTRYPYPPCAAPAGPPSWSAATPCSTSNRPTA